MKTIVVTGAARGIGKAITEALLKQEHTVIGVFRTKESATQLRQAVSNSSGKLISVFGDLRKPAELLAIAKQISEQTSALDALINNAGIIGSSTSIAATTIEEMQEVHQVNVMAPFQLTNLLLPLLRKSTDARIIHLSSGMGALSDLNGSYGAYRMPKASLNMLTMMQAGALQHEQISVYSACPGWVKTDMGGASAPRTPEQGADTPVWLATTDKPQPTGKFYRDRKIISY